MAASSTWERRIKDAVDALGKRKLHIEAVGRQIQANGYHSWPNSQVIASWLRRHQWIPFTESGTKYYLAPGTDPIEYREMMEEIRNQKH